MTGLTATPLRAALPLAMTTALLFACADNNNNNNDTQPPPVPAVESITVTSYNMGLALNVVAYTEERFVVNDALLADYESDVICFQEVWLEHHVDTLTQTLQDDYPHIYTVPPEQVFTSAAACTVDEVSGFADCAKTACPGLSGSELVACAPIQCPSFLNALSPTCFEGVVGAVGIPDITVDALVEQVTQPAGKFAYGGSLGLMLASKYALAERDFQDFIDDSSGNHRGAIYAEVTVGDRAHVIGCTHPTANLGATISYPAAGNHGSWEAENRFQQERMISFVNEKAGSRPIFFAGDFNCSIENASNGVDAEFADNCQLWIDDGFSDPAGDQLPCTFCYSENLILQEVGRSGDTLLDHVFVKNLSATGSTVAERVFDDPVSIEALVPAAELQPEDSPLLTHPSDHFGVEIEIGD